MGIIVLVFFPVLALENESSHPIAAGFRRAFTSMDAPTACLTTHQVGGGIEGTVAGRHVVVGSPAFVEARAIPGPPLSTPPSDRTPVLVAVDGVIIASAALPVSVAPFTGVVSLPFSIL